MTDHAGWLRGNGAWQVCAHHNKGRSRRLGEGDLLLNDIAWELRRFPLFRLYGNGEYTVQPIYVEDVVGKTVEASSQRGNLVADAAGVASSPSRVCTVC